jgi:hypothetical protein
MVVLNETVVKWEPERIPAPAQNPEAAKPDPMGKIK